MNRIQVGNDQIRYYVKENPSSNYIQLRFKRNKELEVSIPSTRQVDVNKVLRKKKAWIQRKYHEITSTRRIFDGKRVLFKGVPYRITFNSKEANPIVRKAQVILPLPVGEQHQEVLQRWMSKETRKFAKRKLTIYSRKLGLCFQDFSVRETRRWAYCTKDGKVVFNWRLIALPEDLADFVVLHEINHLNEFNHSKKFKYSLASLCPDFKEKENRLKYFAT